MRKKLTTEQFIKKVKLKHGDLYDYSLSNYINNYEKIKIICKIHGVFEQIPSDHYQHGCNKCAIEYRALSITKSQECFLKECYDIHGDRYDYSLVKYINNRTKIEIICRVHGSFLQKAGYHLSGCNCPICSKCGVSKMEKNWLDSLKIPLQYRQYTIKIDNKKYRVDGFDPITNTIYEFYGDFWHGNPKVYSSDEINDANHVKFGKLYEMTLERENLFKALNYTIISKWET